MEQDEENNESLKDGAVAVPSMDERRLQLLASVFKGSVPHEVARNTMRKPSVLTLTRRSTASNSSSPDKMVGSQAVNFLSKKNFDNESRNKLLQLLNPSHEKIDTSVDNNTPFTSDHVNTIQEHDYENVINPEEEEQIQAVLETLEFHSHTDQSISKIDVEVQAEQLWLQEHPQSATWDQLYSRIMQYKTRDGIEQKNLENEIADRFINTSLLQGAEHINNLLNGADNKKERLVVHIAFEFLYSIVDSLCEELVGEMAQLSQQSWGVVNKSLMKSIGSVSLGLESSSSRFWKMSGREHLLKGLLADSQRGRGLVHCSTTTSSSAYSGPQCSSSIGEEVNISLPLLKLDTGQEEEDSTNLPQRSHPHSYDKIVALPGTIPVDSEEEEEGREDNDHKGAVPLLQQNKEGSRIETALHGSADVQASLFSVPGSSTNSHSNSHQNTTSLNSASASTAIDPEQQLYEIELTHWTGITFTPVVNAPLQIPSDLATPTSTTTGVVTYIHLIPQPSTHYASLLLCGLSNGRVAIYTVRWTGQDSELIGITAPLDKKEQSPVVDIKTTIIGTNTILTRTQKGFIYIYLMNNALNAESETGLAPVNKKRTYWFPFHLLFRRKVEYRRMRVCPLLYRIEPTDNMFYLPNLLDTLDTISSEHTKVEEVNNNNNTIANTTNNSNNTDNDYNSNVNIAKASSSSRGSAQDSSIFPSAMCFHPSLTLLGSCTSILVGTSSGDVVKYNLDYMISSLVSSIVYPTIPFVCKEYLHPYSAPTGFVLTSGVAEKRGNKVFRELFHYHKSKVIFISSVNILSSYIISIDQSGLVALWQYKEEYFEGKCWFRPYKTVKLSLFCPDLVPTSSLERLQCKEDIAISSIVDSGSSGDASTTTDTAVGKVPNTSITTTSSDGINTADVTTQQQQDTTTAAVADTEETTLPLPTIPTTNIPAPTHIDSSTIPPTDILSQLKVREVYEDQEKQRLYKWYMPVYSEPRDAWLQYRSIEYEEPIHNQTTASNNTTTATTLHANVGGKPVELPASPNRRKVNKLSFAAVASTAVSSGGKGLSPDSSVVAPADLSAVSKATPAVILPSSPSEIGTSTVPNVGTVGIEDPTQVPEPVQVDHNQSMDTVEDPTEATKPAEGTAVNTLNESTSQLPVGTDTTETVPVQKEALSEEVVSPLHLNYKDTQLVAEKSTSPSPEVTVPVPPLAEVTTAPISIEDTETKQETASQKKGVTAVSIEHCSTDIEGKHDSAEVAVLEDDDLEEPPPSTLPLPDGTENLPVPTDMTSEAAEVVGTSVKIAIGNVTTLLTATTSTTVPTAVATGGAAALDSGRSLPTVKVSSEVEFPVTVFTRLLDIYKHHHGTTSTNTADGDNKIDDEVLQLPPVPPLSLDIHSSELPVQQGDATTTAGQGLDNLLIPPPSAPDHLPEPPISQVPNRTVVHWSDEILIERELSFTILSAKMSFDGTEVVLLLASRVNMPTSVPSSSQDAAPSSTSGLTVYYIIPYLALTEQFHKLYPKLYLNTDVDAVVDYCVGPILFETHTRSAFVLTKQSVRVFSMHTGREILTHTIPFVWDLESFTPTMVSVCSSQRVLTLAALDDARVAVYLLQHNEDGTQNKTSEEEQQEQLLRTSLSKQVCVGKHSPERAIQAPTEPLQHIVRTVLSITLPTAAHHQAVVVDVHDIVESVLEHVMWGLDEVHDRQRRVGFISELYGGNLGFIAPTTWPPPVDLPALQISAPDVEEHTEEGAFSPNSISTTRGKAQRNKKKHRKTTKIQHTEVSEVVATPSIADNVVDCGR